MKLYKIIFNGINGIHTRYILANSMGDAESIWKQNPDRYDIQSISMISDKVLMETK